MSCWSGKPSEVTDEIFGTYVFQFPSNEVEILTINSDSTYVQKIYRNKKDFKDKTNPIYMNNDKWSSFKDNLRFKNWLAYCYLRYPDSILPKPQNVNMNDVSWNEPTWKHNGYVSIFYESNYIFSHIDDWKQESSNE